MTGARTRRSSFLLVERVVLAAFGDSTPRTRAQLIAETGLSRAVVAAAVEALIDRGEVVEVDGPHTNGTRGRPSTHYRRAALLAPVLLVRLRRDTTTALELIDDDHSSVATGAVPWAASWDEWAAAARKGADELIGSATANPRLVVIAAPFPVQDGQGLPPFHALPPGRRRNPKRVPPRPEWLIEDPRPRVAELLGRSVVMVNDSNLAALGEAVFGAGRGYQAVMHLSVAEGFGAGFVFGGTVYVGAGGFAGELAHVQVAEDGDFCTCGNRGCLATETRATGVAAALSKIYGQEVTFEEVRSQLAVGDPIAMRYFRDMGTTIGRPLSTVVSLLAPDCLVVDGNLQEAADALIAGLSAQLTHRCAPELLSNLSITHGTLDNPIAAGAVATANTLARPF